MKEQDFFKHIKQSLKGESHQPYDLEDWYIIEEQLDDKHKKRFGFYWFFGFAFLLLGTILIWNFSKKEILNDTVFLENKNLTSSTIDKNYSPKTTPNNITETTSKTSKTIELGLTTLTNENNFKSFRQNPIVDNRSNTFTKNSSSNNKIYNNVFTKNKPFPHVPNQLTNFEKKEEVTKYPERTPNLLLEKIPPLPSKKIQSKQKVRKSSNRHFSIQQNYIGTLSNGLRIDPVPEMKNYPKRKVIGVLGGTAILNDNISYSDFFKYPLLISVRTRYFLNPKWNIDMDISMLRRKLYSEDVYHSLSPSPSLEPVSNDNRALIARYKLGVNYWIGNNEKWKPYVGISFVGNIVSVDKQTSTYNNINTDLQESLFQQTTIWGEENYLPVTVDLKMGLVYRFNNPRYSCQLEISNNQRFIDRQLYLYYKPYIIDITGGVFYHF